MVAADRKGSGMLRKIGGIVAGIIVFVVTLAVLELLAHQLFPSDGRNLSTGLLAFVALAYFLSAFAGGLTAARISGLHWTVWVIALLVAAGAAYSLTAVAHPVWMQIASIAAPLLGGFLASRFAPPTRSVADADL